MTKLKKMIVTKRVIDLPANAFKLNIYNEVEFEKVIDKYLEHFGYKTTERVKHLMRDKLEQFVKKQRFNTAIVAFWVETGD